MTYLRIIIYCLVVIAAAVLLGLCISIKMQTPATTPPVKATPPPQVQTIQQVAERLKPCPDESDWAALHKLFPILGEVVNASEKALVAAEKSIVCYRPWAEGLADHCQKEGMLKWLGFYENKIAERRKALAKGDDRSTTERGVGALGVERSDMKPAGISAEYTIVCRCGRTEKFGDEYAAWVWLLRHIQRSHKPLSAKLEIRGRSAAKSQNGCGYYDDGRSRTGGWHAAQVGFREAWRIKALKRLVYGQEAL